MDFGREKAMSNGVPNTNAWVRRILSVRCDLRVMSYESTPRPSLGGETTRSQHLG